MPDDDSEDDLPEPTVFSSAEDAQVWSGFFASLANGAMHALRKDDELDFEVLAVEADEMLVEYLKRKKDEE